VATKGSPRVVRMQISYIPPDRIFLGGLITYMIGIFEHLLPKFIKKLGRTRRGAVGRQPVGPIGRGTRQTSR
jgi:hypothetical protein